MDDNTAAIIFWLALLLFIIGLVGIVAWFMSRRRTTEVIVQQQPAGQWYQQPQAPQIAPPPDYQAPPAYWQPQTTDPTAFDSPAEQDQPPPHVRQGGYRELLQESQRESEGRPGQGGLN